MLDEFSANHPMRTYNLIFGFVLVWAAICVVVTVHQIMKRQANSTPTPISLETLYAHPAEPEWVEVSGWITKDEWLYHIKSSKEGVEAEYIAIRLQDRQVDPVHILVDVKGISDDPEALQLLSRGIVRGTRKELSSKHRRLMEGAGPPSPGNERAPWPLAANTEVILAGDRPGNLGLAAALFASVVFFGGFALYGLQVQPRRRLREKSKLPPGIEQTAAKPVSHAAQDKGPISTAERPPWESGPGR